MKRFLNLPAMLLGVLLAACAVGWFATRDSNTPKPRKTSETTLIDQRLIETAQSMAGVAETQAERDLSRETLRLTDHELDQSFATALREATETAPPTSGPLKEMNARIAKIKTKLAADQQRVAKLANSSDGQLDLAKAQLELDQDELDDAQQDLARLGGDRHARLEAALQTHEAAQHQQSQPVRAANPPPTGTLRCMFPRTTKSP